MQHDRMTVIELCARAAASRRPDDSARQQGVLAGKVAAFLIEWAMMIRDTGLDDPSVADFQRWANVPHRTAWARMADFQSLFPGQHRPTAIASTIDLGKRRRPSLASPVAASA